MKRVTGVAFFVLALSGSVALAGPQAGAASIYDALGSSDGFALGKIVDLKHASRDQSTKTVGDILVERSSMELDDRYLEVDVTDVADRLNVGDRVVVFIASRLGDGGAATVVGGANGIYRVAQGDEQNIADLEGRWVYGFSSEGLVIDDGDIALSTLPSSEGRSPIDVGTFLAIAEGNMGSLALQSTLRQVLVEATCTAIRPGRGWTFAVMRDCSSTTPTCARICGYIYESQAGWLSCFNSIHLYGNDPAGGAGQIGLKTHRYNACGGGCGPNFCCCGN